MLVATNSDGYPSPAGIAVDPVVLTVLNGHLHVLLWARTETPLQGVLGLPGGFQGDSEGADETVIRKLQEKTGVQAAYMEKLTFHAELGRDPRGWMPSLSYLTLVSPDALQQSDALWVDVNDLPDLAFDHKIIVAEGVQRLSERAKDLTWFAAKALNVLGTQFTLRQAWTLYGQVTGIVAENQYANFRRDLSATGLLEPTGEFSRGVGRPAELYKLA